MNPPADIAGVASGLSRLARFDHVLLAVSGGADSTALMHLAMRAHGVFPQTRLSVATVDHGLRPGSADEARTVARAAQALHLPHATLEWTGAKPSRSIEEAARAARYACLAAHAHAIGADAIATAHTLEDQAETLLMRLARGSGVDGLSAMAPESRMAGLALARPLLGVRKADLVTFLRESGVAWIEDETNADPAYERARLRQAQGAMAALGLTQDALARTARRMTRARAALDAMAETWVAGNVRIDPSGSAELDASSLDAAPGEIGLRAMQRLLGMVGGRLTPLSLSGLERLLDSLQSAPQKTHTFGGCRIAPSGQLWSVTREIRRPGLTMLELKPGQQALWDGRFHVALAAHESRAVDVRALGPEGLAYLRGQAQHALVTRHAVYACATFWRDDRLLAAPSLGFSPPGAPAATSEFVHG